MQGRDQKVKDTCSQHSCWQDVRAQYLPSHCCSSFLFSSEMIFLLQLPTPETFHSLPSLHISDQPLKLSPGQSTASRLCLHHPPRAPRVLLGHPLTEQTVSPTHQPLLDPALMPAQWHFWPSLALPWTLQPVHSFPNSLFSLTCGLWVCLFEGSA